MLKRYYTIALLLMVLTTASADVSYDAPDLSAYLTTEVVRTSEVAVGASMPVLAAHKKDDMQARVLQVFGEKKAGLIPVMPFMVNKSGIRGCVQHNRSAHYISFRTTSPMMPTTTFSSSNSRYTSHVRDFEPKVTATMQRRVNGNPDIPFPDPLDGTVATLMLLAIVFLIVKKSVKKAE